jgi:hypothetical protein
MARAESEDAGAAAIEEQIGEWRSHLRRSRAISPADAQELEDHLRERMDALLGQGLARDEAFLVAVKRMGSVDALTREFAREHSDRLWKQLVLPGDGREPGSEPPPDPRTTRAWVALALAVAAAVSVKSPALFGRTLTDHGPFYALNASFFAWPFLAAWFAWERAIAGAARAWVAGAFVASGVAVNLFPFSPAVEGERVPDTLVLAALHLPVALWLAVGVAYVGGRWRGSERRMDFVRFTGELFVYYVLIALGGGVLVGLTFALFGAIGVDVEPVVQEWVVPCGAAGATVVATWLVEAKKSVVENMAPVLARVFVPLFALVLVAFLATMAATGRGLDVEREILVVVDFLLVVVFGLLLYSISARDPLAPPTAFDALHLVLVAAALVVDVLALWAIGSRISEFGWTPNRSAGLGLNVVLLGNLAGSAVHYARFLRSGGGVARLWAWQVAYVPVLAAWAAVVAFLFPLLFDFA